MLGEFYSWMLNSLCSLLEVNFLPSIFLLILAASPRGFKSAALRWTTWF